MRNDTTQDDHQMRGADITQEFLFITVHLEAFVPANPPMRPIRELLIRP
jgi:hypothetical protein